MFHSWNVPPRYMTGDEDVCITGQYTPLGFRLQSMLSRNFLPFRSTCVNPRFFMELLDL